MEKLQKEYDIEVDWRAFEIMPEGRPRPSTEELREGFESFKKMAEKEGLTVHFNPNFSSSRLALEGAKYAQQKGKIQEYNSRVYEAQFVNSRNIADIEVLTGIAEQAGLDPQDFKTALEERRLKEQVDKDMEEAKELGVKAAPTFFIDSTKIVGSRTEDIFRKALENAVNT